MTSMRDKANDLLHQRVLAGFLDLDYEILDAGTEQGRNCFITGRQHDSEVVLPTRLRRALQSLNPGVSPELLEDAIEQLAQSRSLLVPARANQDVYRLLKDGIKLGTTSPEAEENEASDEKVTLQVVDWKEPLNNDFLLVTNFGIDGQLGRGRLDYVGFVNGLPWLLPVVRIAEQRKDLLFNKTRR